MPELYGELTFGDFELPLTLPGALLPQGATMETYSFLLPGFTTDISKLPGYLRAIGVSRPAKKGANGVPEYDSDPEQASLMHWVLVPSVHLRYEAQELAKIIELEKAGISSNPRLWLRRSVVCGTAVQTSVAARAVSAVARSEGSELTRTASSEGSSNRSVYLRPLDAPDPRSMYTSSGHTVRILPAPELLIRDDTHEPGPEVSQGGVYIRFHVLAWFDTHSNSSQGGSGENGG